jgi:hypothetical protein
MNARSRLLIVIVFFVLWIAVLYAGADHPPPRGFFTLLMPLVAACALFFYWRIPAYADWSRSGRIARVAVDGIIAGAVVAGIVMLLSTGEPTITPGTIDRLIFVAVLAGVGMLNVLLVYAVVKILDRV